MDTTPTVPTGPVHFEYADEEERSDADVKRERARLLAGVVEAVQANEKRIARLEAQLNVKH